MKVHGSLPEFLHFAGKKSLYCTSKTFTWRIMATGDLQPHNLSCCGWQSFSDLVSAGIVSVVNICSYYNQLFPSKVSKVGEGMGMFCIEPKSF